MLHFTLTRYEYSNTEFTGIVNEIENLLRLNLNNHPMNEMPWLRHLGIISKEVDMPWPSDIDLWPKPSNLTLIFFHLTDKFQVGMLVCSAIRVVSQKQTIPMLRVAVHVTNKAWKCKQTSFLKYSMANFIEPNIDPGDVFFSQVLPHPVGFRAKPPPLKWRATKFSICHWIF